MKVISVVWPYKLLALVELYVKLYVVNLGARILVGAYLSSKSVC